MKRFFIPSALQHTVSSFFAPPTLLELLGGFIPGLGGYVVRITPIKKNIFMAMKGRGHKPLTWPPLKTKHGHQTSTYLKGTSSEPNHHFLMVTMLVFQGVTGMILQVTSQNHPPKNFPPAHLRNRWPPSPCFWNGISFHCFASTCRGWKQLNNMFLKWWFNGDLAW